MEQSAPLPAETEPSVPETQVIVLPARTARLKLRLEAPEDVQVRVELESAAPDGRITGRQVVTLGAGQAAQAGWMGFLAGRWHALAALDAAVLSNRLFWIALGLYLAVRWIALPEFPIFFFTDEAIQTVSAADLLHNGFRGPAGEWLPVFFANGTQYNLSLSVYLQVLPYLVLGKSIWVTRGAAALVTLLAAWSTGRMLKDVFHSPYSWLGVLVLSLTPAWFLHSRTAFETTLAASLYAAFLYSILRYRTGQPRALYAAVLFAALTCYAYSAARVVVAVTALLFLLSDLRYHVGQRKLLVRALALALLLALPFARFLSQHPEATGWQMRLLGSVWVMDLPLGEKLLATLQEYLRGLNPLYWYLPHSEDLPRHTMRGYGHLLRPFLPLGLAGLGLALWRARTPAYRVLVIAVLAAPAGAALVKLGITRALVMVIPAAILTSLALAAGIDWAKRRWNLPQNALAICVFVLLAAGNLAMLRDARVNGPTWYSDYSLTGMQFGARPLFGALARDVNASPGTRFVVSPAWTNGTDVVARFFFEDPLPIELGSAAGYYNEGRPLDPNMVFVMTPEEFDALPRSRFSAVTVLKTLPYPDGRPGFFFTRLAYVPDIQTVIETEREAKRRPRLATVQINGQPVELAHTRLDIGEPSSLFDGNLDTLIRTEALNPLVLDFSFPSAQQVHFLNLQIGGTATAVEVEAWQEGSAVPVRVTQQFDEAPLPRNVQCELLPGTRFTRIRLALYNANDLPESHVHLWELTFVEQ